MEKIVFKKTLFDTIEKMEKYKYSSKPLLKNYIKQFFVVFLSNIVTLLLLTIDGLVVSLFVGEDALNSVNLLNPVVLIGGAITVIPAQGVGFVLSKTFGIGSESEIKKTLRASMLLAVVFLIAKPLIQLPITYVMINSYFVSAEIKQLMNLYAIGIIISEAVSVINTIGTYILIASGRVNDLFKLSILECSLNLVLDLLFVPVLNMGVLGAGLATAISCTARGIVTIVIIAKEFNIFSIERIPCKDKIKDILNNGISKGLFLLTSALSKYIITMMFTKFVGIEAITVISVCGIASSLAQMIATSFIQSGSVVIGLFAGSDDWEVASDIAQKIRSFCIFGVSLFVIGTIVFIKVLFSTYGINEYTDFQLLSARLYMFSYIPFGYLLFLQDMCAYCDKKKESTVVSVLNGLLIIPIMYIFQYLNKNLVFLCYGIDYIISTIILSIVVYKEMNKRIIKSKYSNRIHLTFTEKDAIDVSQKLNNFLVKNNAPKRIAYRIALICEELGSYAKNKVNDIDTHIFLSICMSNELMTVLYLDDSEPAIMNKKLTATNLILGNYNLIESVASEFTYQCISGMNNFIIKIAID